MNCYAVISDVHGNLHALEAVLARIERLAIHEIICLGDVVGYGPFPDRCIDLVTRYCSTIVRGNHDDALINPNREAEFNGVAREAINWSRGVLGPLHMDALCRFREIEYPHESVMCVHDSPVPAPTDYVHDPHIAALAFGGFSTPLCLVGHTHVPMVFEEPAGAAGRELTAADIVAQAPRDGQPIQLAPDRRYICNPGSVGQPRDADPRASFAVLDLDGRTFTVHRIEYDIDAAQLATQQAGLPTVLADRLAIGA
ncbi:MAG: metallophosphoesterase family protein [Planctomycetota bacterium]|jgi:diadenosine tetraphosphatase ApaH/serine/threonine PP2A family protein phosphatase